MSSENLNEILDIAKKHNIPIILILKYFEKEEYFKERCICVDEDTLKYTVNFLTLCI